MIQTLLFFIFSVLFITARCDRLFLIGDSIDRYVVDDYCAKMGQGVKNYPPNIQQWAELNDWGDGSIRYGRLGSQLPTQECVTSENDSVAFLHIFGSNPIGPYYMNRANSNEDNFVDTNKRVPKAIKLYLEHIGRPDRVIVHTINWDAQGVYELFNAKGHPEPIFDIRNTSIHGTLYVDLCENFRNSTLILMDEVKRLFNDDTIDFGFRTAVRSMYGADLVLGYNDIIREIASDLNLTLYDFDADLWSRFEYDMKYSPEVLRDFIHPLPQYTSAAAKKMLGYQYSEYYLYKGRQNLTMWDLNDLKVVVPLLRIHEPGNIENHGKIFYSVVIDNTQRSVFHVSHHHHKEFFSKMFLTVKDCMNLSYVEFAKLPVRGHVPMRFFHVVTHLKDIYANITGVNTTNGHIYLFDDHGYVRYVPEDFLQNLTSVVGLWFTYFLEHDVDEHFVINMKRGLPLQDVYHQNSLLRFYTHKDIFVLRDGYLHLVPNVNVFMQYGYDFENVVAMKEYADMKIIPFGETLTPPNQFGSATRERRRKNRKRLRQ